MSCFLRTALVASLSAYLILSRSRIETLSSLIVGLIHGRSVNLTHIASHCRGPACYASKYRRLQRFFQHVRLDQAVIAALVIRMLKLARPKCLALDRANWKIGRHDVNILMLAIVTRRFRVPLFWMVLCHQGNGNTTQRIALLKQYLALFEPGSIENLLADREFIGTEWFKIFFDESESASPKNARTLHSALGGRVRLLPASAGRDLDPISPDRHCTTCATRPPPAHPRYHMLLRRRGTRACTR